jgi:hypothetical protein
MVGAQLEGFDTMVHLTEENDFIVLKEMNICLRQLTADQNFICTNIALISGMLGIILMFFQRMKITLNSLKFYWQNY